MRARPTRDLPARLEGVRRRFERWRGTHQARTRIPDRLWAAAVKVAGMYGIHRAAKALRVDYYSLKKRVEGALLPLRAGCLRGLPGRRFSNSPLPRGLARLCQEALSHDPFTGWVFVFRNRRATALKILVYDGQGFWLCHKRLSSGRFPWWPTSRTAAV